MGSAGPWATRLPPPVFTIPQPDPALNPPVAQDPLLTRFLLFAPEYRPEVVDALVPVGSTVAQALEILQLLRAPLSIALFPALVPVQPQPLRACALCLAIPSWTTDRYILLDCSRVNGTVFCALCADVTNRASLLAIARLPRDPALEVYVNDRVLPLGEGRTDRFQCHLCPCCPAALCGNGLRLYAARSPFLG